MREYSIHGRGSRLAPGDTSPEKNGPGGVCSNTTRTGSVSLVSALARQGTRRRRAACTHLEGQRSEETEGLALRFGDRPATQFVCKPQSAPLLLACGRSRATVRPRSRAEQRKRVRLADACSLGERSAEWVGPCLCLEGFHARCVPMCKCTSRGGPWVV